MDDPLSDQPDREHDNPSKPDRTHDDVYVTNLVNAIDFLRLHRFSANLQIERHGKNHKHRIFLVQGRPFC